MSKEQFVLLPDPLAKGLSYQRQSHRGRLISYSSLEPASQANCYPVGICWRAAMRLLSLV